MGSEMCIRDSREGGGARRALTGTTPIGETVADGLSGPLGLASNAAVLILLPLGCDRFGLDDHLGEPDRAGLG